jgi:endonuclease YncB( thermonuclease family)
MFNAYKKIPIGIRMKLMQPLRSIFILALISGLLTGCMELSAPPAANSSDESFSCIPSGQTPQTATVTHIADGDTITVDIDGERYRVRYIGINTPELDSAEDDLAQQAKQLNALLVDGQEVELYRDTSETDQYDRLLRYVVIDDTFVNYELVAQGMARAKDYRPDTACSQIFKQAQDQAKTNDLGIWDQ